MAFRRDQADFVTVNLWAAGLGGRASQLIGHFARGWVIVPSEWLRLQLLQQPGFGIHPVTLSGAVADAQGCGCFGSG